MSGSMLRVAVLMGGTSAEREVSLASGRAILQNLNPQRSTPLPIVIQQDGSWSLTEAGQPEGTDGRGNSPGSVLERARPDVVLLALHGPGGEDGTVQGLLEQYGVPYTCSGVLASALAMHKVKTKIVLVAAGLPTPRWETIPPHVSLDEGVQLARAFSAENGYPLVVKPADSGSSFGVSLAHSEAELSDTLRTAREIGSEVLIEEWVSGREMSCGVLGNSADGHAEALPVTEIIPDGEFFDFENKYTQGQAREVTPAELDEETTRMIQDLAVRSHLVLGCDGLSRVDMILRDGEASILEVNTIPGMTETSLCPQQAKAAGMTFGDLLERMIDLALRR